jgi:hypothetical protein
LHGARTANQLAPTGAPCCSSACPLAPQCDTHDTAIAEFNVAAAIGRLIAPQLWLLVRLYDMERHYKAVKNKWIGFAGGLNE